MLSLEDLTQIPREFLFWAHTTELRTPDFDRRLENMKRKIYAYKRGSTYLEEHKEDEIDKCINRILEPGTLANSDSQQLIQIIDQASYINDVEKDQRDQACSSLDFVDFDILSEVLSPKIQNALQQPLLPTPTQVKQAQLFNFENKKIVDKYYNSCSKKR